MGSKSVCTQIRKVIIQKGVWKVAMPGLATVAEVKHDIQMEQQPEQAMKLLAQVQDYLSLFLVMVCARGPTIPNPL